MNFHQKESGRSAVEFILILILIIVVAIVIYNLLHESIDYWFNGTVVPLLESFR